MAENESGIEVEGRVEKHEDPYVKVIYDMSVEPPQIKVETNTPNYANTLGLLIDGLPFVYQLHMDEEKGKKGKIINPNLIHIVPGAKVL